MPSDAAVELLRANPRVFWGHAIRILIERGWSPPPPDEKIVDDLLEAMARVEYSEDNTVLRLLSSEREYDLDDQLYILTRREREIANLLPFGLTNDQIAGRLGVAPQTIKFHLTSIYRKLEVRSRQEVVALIIGASLDSTG